MIRYAPFVPHSYAHLVEKNVFVPALPEKFYADMVRDYEALDVATHAITYDSGGVAVKGLCVMPREVKPGGHPVLIYNRGGKGEYGKLTLLSVMRSMVPFARQGYLVFASNYRGNDGGEGVDEFGGADVEDVLSLLTLARVHEGFDGQNAFMVGHSRGGMMTYLALKQRAPVRAAVSIAGISEVYPEGFSRVMPQGARVEDYAERSALQWPEKLMTPLLLLHGTADEKIEAHHSVELAKKLEALRRQHALELYDGGNHALVRHWDAVLARINKWLEAHAA